MKKNENGGKTKRNGKGEERGTEGRKGKQKKKKWNDEREFEKIEMKKRKS